MAQIDFRLDVEPRGQGRPRVGAVKVGKKADGSDKWRGMAFKDDKSREHEGTLRALVSQYRPKNDDGTVRVIERPVQVTIVAVMPRPASLKGTSKRTGEPLRNKARRWDTRKPDGDNIAKGLLDAMKDWWVDDSQVAVLAVLKQVAAFGEAPHYSVQVTELGFDVDGGGAPCWSAKAADVFLLVPF